MRLTTTWRRETGACLHNFSFDCIIVHPSYHHTVVGITFSFSMPYVLPSSFSMASWIFLRGLSRSRWAGLRGGSWSSWNIGSRCFWTFLLLFHCKFRLSCWGAFLTLRSHRKWGKQSRSKRLMQVGSCFCIILSCWLRLDIPSLMLRLAVWETFLCVFRIFLYGT